MQSVVFGVNINKRTSRFMIKQKPWLPVLAYSTCVITSEITSVQRAIHYTNPMVDRETELLSTKDGTGQG